MKLFKTVILLFAGSLLLTDCAGCSDRKQEKTAEDMRPPHLDFSSEDTMQVKMLADEYLDAFAAKDYQAAANLLYRFEKDSVRQLTAAEKASYVKTMSQLPNYGVKLKGITMLTENNNRLDYLLQVISSGNLDEEQGIMRFHLNPVMVKGQWFLTLLDMEQEGTKDIFQ